MNRSSFLYFLFVNRIRSVATVYGAYSSVCALLTTVLGIAVLLVVSLIPLYINESSSQALGEQYCINNYSMIVNFQIPQYNTSFGVTLTSGTYTPSTSAVAFSPGVTSCTGPIFVSTSETVQLTDTCSFGLLSIIYPAVPNAQVFESYALGEACYRTLQSCNYDPLLSACILSSCYVSSSTDANTNGSYPSTNYRLRCTANIYYKARCTDEPVNSGLYYSASQQNSVCRQQRLNRINTCLNSTATLSTVPSLISVSSGIVTSTIATCTQVSNTNTIVVRISDAINGNSTSTLTASQISGSLTPAFSSPIFWASDQYGGHAYRISSVNSETYPSTQSGALYCGGVTTSQIAASVTAAIANQNSF